ncbi:aminotransferase class V-fold PLP-dependent enzyme [Streptomyces flaveolus]|uniref:Aminotransferase class V-fold PLP-dependent enzyme n=1 Tax=Streptomyces flaveolus TaxID=67297 RepID=A0ABV1VTU3_9ACTN
MNRRKFMASAAATPGAAGALPVMTSQAHADTRSLPSLWDVDRSVVNLENAYWGVMPRSVEQEYAKQTRYLNRHNVTFVRDGIPGHERTVAMDQVRAEVAQLMGASKEEFTLTRNGTEAMQNLILQYGFLNPGDAVMYADLDYDEIQQAMASLTRRRGVQVIKFSVPEPATTANILDAYQSQLNKTPAGLKLLLVTHLSNRTGIVMPVREIVSMARARGVDTLVDATQTIGHLDYTLSDLDADFVGFSLHKWLCAPLGTGAIWIRGSRWGSIEPCMGNTMFPPEDTRSRSSVGTVNFAADLTVPKAIEFHRGIEGTAEATTSAVSSELLGGARTGHRGHTDPHTRRHGTPRSGDQLSTSCDEGLRAGTEDGDAAAQEAPCSHSRAHGYRTGQRRPGNPHAVQHA